MFWRKETPEDTQELRQFVDGMKRGQTLATNDSLLETLRQIHDRRETPAPVHDHRQMLLERLRREMRVRSGEAVQDATWVPSFAEPAPRRRFIEWAVAASLVFHVALGGYVLTQRMWNAAAAPAETASTEHSELASPTMLTLPPRLNDVRDTRQQVSLRNDTSVRAAGKSSALNAASPVPTASPVPSVSAIPVGLPVAPGGGAPIVPGFSSAGLEGQADRNISDSAGPSMKGPDEPRPFTEVSPFNVDRDDPVTSEYDSKPRLLFSPTPTYPDKAFRYQVAGKVRVAVTIGADGNVRDVDVRRGLGYGCDEAAIDAVRRSKFAPATRGGVAVAVRIVVDIAFEIH